jgi:metallo-beta-lactamase family protein
MELTFCGAAGTVTGSKYLVKTGGEQFLVDCGLFQGLKELQLRNWNTPPFNPRDIHAVLLTHAHIDHSGYIPLLVKNGFKGKIYCSPATADLCSILLPDSAHIQEEEALRANKYGYTKHHPALPLYTREDADAALKHFFTVPFGHDFSLTDSFSFRLQHAGHILGASMVRIFAEHTSILFSGDIGRMNDEIMKAPHPIDTIDYLVLESTYGDRLHDEKNPIDQLAQIVNRISERGGVLVIPAFAVGRAQNILYYLHQLKRMRRIADLPIYLDSPMAISATELFWKYSNEHHLSLALAKEVCDSATYINTPEESKHITEIAGPKIIISASGMITAGRVLHHIKTFANDEKNGILLTGYQAEGTRGAKLAAGEKQIKLLGETVSINAEVCELKNTSAHADYAEILTWLKKFKKAPREVFLTHGEQKAALAMQQHIEDTLGWKAKIPQYLETVSL